MKKTLAVKNGYILMHDENYNDFYFGTETQIKNLSMPCNQYGTLKEIKSELTRWKNEVDYNNPFMLEVENAFLLALTDNEPLEKHPETMRPLSGKYAKLRNDLREMAKIGAAASDSVADGGAFNFDAPALSLPRWKTALVEQAAKEADCSCHDWTLWGKKYFVFFPFGVNGNANKRSEAAEAMFKHLDDIGYDAFCYQALD